MKSKASTEEKKDKKQGDMTLFGNLNVPTFFTKEENYDDEEDQEAPSKIKSKKDSMIIKKKKKLKPLTFITSSSNFLSSLTFLGTLSPTLSPTLSHTLLGTLSSTLSSFPKTS